MKLSNQQVRAAAAILGGVVFVTTTVIQHVKEKREAEREAKEQIDRQIAFEHAKEMLETVTEDLDRRIAIAKKALLDDDFNQIIKDF